MTYLRYLAINIPKQKLQVGGQWSHFTGEDRENIQLRRDRCTAANERRILAWARSHATTVERRVRWERVQRWWSSYEWHHVQA